MICTWGWCFPEKVSGRTFCIPLPSSWLFCAPSHKHAHVVINEHASIDATVPVCVFIFAVEWVWLCWEMEEWEEAEYGCEKSSMELASSLPLLKRDAWLCWESSTTLQPTVRPWPAKFILESLQEKKVTMWQIACILTAHGRGAHAYLAFVLLHSDAGDTLFGNILLNNA